MIRIQFFLLTAYVFFSVSCFKKPDQKPLFELVEHAGIDFNNKVTDGKLENSFLFRNFYNGGGVATGDLNNDGLPDIFFTSNMGDNKVYLNKGNLKFEDITSSSGIFQDSMWSIGVVFADINHDGWLDIYVCNLRPYADRAPQKSAIYKQPQLTFTESAAKYGLDISPIPPVSFLIMTMMATWIVS
jgi:hypothetical protein